MNEDAFAFKIMISMTAPKAMQVSQVSVIFLGALKKTVTVGEPETLIC